MSGIISTVEALSVCMNSESRSADLEGGKRQSRLHSHATCHIKKEPQYAIPNKSSLHDNSSHSGSNRDSVLGGFMDGHAVDDERSSGMCISRYFLHVSDVSSDVDNQKNFSILTQSLLIMPKPEMMSLLVASRGSTGGSRASYLTDEVEQQKHRKWPAEPQQDE